MSVFGQMAASGGSVLMATHGDSVVYTPSGQASQNLTAAVGEERVSLEDFDDGRHRVRRRRCLILIADLASPERGATLVAGGVEYRVADFSTDKMAHELELERVETSEYSGQGFRQRR